MTEEHDEIEGRSRGRPRIGPKISFRAPAELKARIEARVKPGDRSKRIRRLVELGLAAEEMIEKLEREHDS